MNQLHFLIFPQRIDKRVDAKEFIQIVQIPQMHTCETLRILQRSKVARSQFFGLSSQVFETATMVSCQALKIVQVVSI